MRIKWKIVRQYKGSVGLIEEVENKTRPIALNIIK